MNQRFKILLFLALWLAINLGIAGADEAPRAKTASGDAAEPAVVRAIRAYVAERLSCGISEIRVRLTGVQSGATALEGLGDEEALDIREANPGALLGRAVFLLSRHGARSPVYQWTSADVERALPVVVSTRPLMRLHVIDPSDLTVQTIYLGQQAGRYLQKPEGLIGKRMSRSIGPGTPIGPELVEEPPLIHQGDRVTLLLEVGPMSITTLGRASEDGFPGRQMAVVNLDSQKVIYGEAVDNSTVKVVIPFP